MFQTTIDKVRLFFRKEKEPFLKLHELLGFYPINIEYYQEALIHKSCAASQPGKHINNERLEFLGDAVLGAVVADILFSRYSSKQEGFLTTVRSRIVRRDTLNHLAKEIGLDKLMRYSSKGTKAHNSNLAGNAFEAFIGAIYLDRGYSYVFKFMEERIFNSLIDIDTMAHKEENFKSKLIEWCQKHQFDFKFSLTNQRMQQESNSPVFTSEVLVEGIICGRGEGYSKKESHQLAAKEAISRVRKDQELLKSIRKIKEERAKYLPESQRQNLLETESQNLPESEK